jgi:hypothetical protein
LRTAAYALALLWFLQAALCMFPLAPEAEAHPDPIASSGHGGRSHHQATHHGPSDEASFPSSDGGDSSGGQHCESLGDAVVATHSAGAMPSPLHFGIASAPEQLSATGPGAAGDVPWRRPPPRDLVIQYASLLI